MGLLNTLAIASTALSANRLWIDTVANNIANINTTRTAAGPGKAYRRQVPVFTEALQDAMSDMGNDDLLKPIMADSEFNSVTQIRGQGVYATGIQEDASPFKAVYNPGHPDANKDGYVMMPNVNIVNEMVDMIAANKAFDAATQVINTTKSMASKAQEIARG